MMYVQVLQGGWLCSSIILRNTIILAPFIPFLSFSIGGDMLSLPSMDILAVQFGCVRVYVSSHLSRRFGMLAQIRYGTVRRS